MKKARVNWLATHWASVPNVDDWGIFPKTIIMMGNLFWTPSYSELIGGLWSLVCCSLWKPNKNVCQFLWLCLLWTKAESCWLTNLTWPCVLHNLERSMMKTLKQHCDGKIWPFNYKGQQIGLHYFHHLPFFFLWWFLIVSIIIPIQFCLSLTLVNWMNYIHELCSNARTWMTQVNEIYPNGWMKILDEIHAISKWEKSYPQNIINSLTWSMKHFIQSLFPPDSIHQQWHGISSMNLNGWAFIHVLSSMIIDGWMNGLLQWSYSRHSKMTLIFISKISSTILCHPWSISRELKFNQPIDE